MRDKYSLSIDLPCFLPSHIEDGESVPSEDFDSGFGCVPVKHKRENVLHAVAKDEFKPLTRAQYEQREREVEQREDDYLKQYGI